MKIKFSSYKNYPQVLPTIAINNSYLMLFRVFADTNRLNRNQRIIPRLPSSRIHSKALSESVQRSKVPIWSDRNIILLVAYMRSGSSFTGAVLSAGQRAFYAFEPIRAIYNAFDRNPANVTLHYFHGTRLDKFISHFLTCCPKST